MSEQGHLIEAAKDKLLGLVMDVLIREALDALKSKASFLFFGPLNPITTHYVTKAIKWGIENLSVFIDIQYAGYKTRMQLEEMYFVLARARSSKTELTDNEKREIDEAIQYTAFKLIHI